MLPYQEDFTYYYFCEKDVVACPLSEVPSSVENYWTINDAVRLMQQKGCQGASFSTSQLTESMALAVAVIKIAIEKYGEEFVWLYRGCTGPDPSDRCLKYAATSLDVAAFYGDVSILKNIKGLRTFSLAQSVLGVDSMDEEIIYIP